jgi:hypothetical protein
VTRPSHQLPARVEEPLKILGHPVEGDRERAVLARALLGHARAEVVGQAGRRGDEPFER